MDLGRNESIAWKDRHPFWGQRNEREGGNEVQEREAGENGESELTLLLQEGCFGGLTL